MSILRLEVFEPAAAPGAAPGLVVTDLGALEEARLAAYELGYRAGWDDAAAAAAEEQGRIRADLGRSLQSMAFTYQEARAHVLAAMEPLLTAIVGRLLPAIARETLAPVVLERLMPMADALADQPVALVLHPAARAMVEALVSQATGLPLTIREEPSLGEAQAYLRIGTAEAKVDLNRATQEIAAAVQAFFTLAEEKPAHG